MFIKMQACKVALVFMVCLIVIFLSRIYGPISQIPSSYAIDVNYLRILEKQYLVMALSCSLAIMLLSQLHRVSMLASTIVMLISGSLFVVLGSMSDPGSMEYIWGAFFEFMVPFMVVWAITVSVVLVVKHLFTTWKHGKK